MHPALLQNMLHLKANLAVHVPGSDGSGQKILTWVGWGQFFVPRVGLGQPSLFYVWQISQIFQFFPFRSKKFLLVGSKSTRIKDESVSDLLQVKSMLWSGWVRDHLYTCHQEFSCKEFNKIKIRFIL